MDLIDLILGVVIGVAVLVQVINWLIEQFGGKATGALPRVPRQRRPTESLSESDDDEIVTFRGGADAAETLTPRVRPASVAGAASGAGSIAAGERGRRLRRQLGLDQRSTLQRSVLLMTILGPCRANEREQSSKPDK